MNHIHEHLTAYLEGNLSVDVQEELHSHCEACPACARVLAESREVWDLLGAVEAPPPEAPLWPGIAAGVAPRRESNWLRWSYPTAAAAALVAGVFLGGLFELPGETADTGYADQIVSGSLLAGGTAWTLDDALTFETDTGEE